MDEDLDSSTLAGTVLADRYQVARVVSSGANTIISDAIDLAAERPVTVKIVQPELAQDAEFRHKFRRLAEISHALTHPNIASVVDWGDLEIGGVSTVYWTVEALGGGSMRDLLDRGRLLSPGQALVVGLEACRALDAAHQKGLFHTELTPSKMVFGADRRLRVVDFGMARLLGESSWADVSSVPTHVARYASPEQALGLPVDAKTDVYALSLVLVEAVTGSVPFDGDSTQATLAARIDKLLPVSADLGALAAVLERAGRPESADRFTAAEFGRALVQAAGKLPKPEPIPILATGLFDTTAMRRPTDPTGGVERPGLPDEAEERDEPSADASAVAAAAAAAGAVAAAEAVPLGEPAPDGGAGGDAGPDSDSVDLATTRPVDAVPIANVTDDPTLDTDGPTEAEDGAPAVDGPAAEDAEAESVDPGPDTELLEVLDEPVPAGDDRDAADDIRLVGDDTGPNGTQQMPASVVAAAETATTPTGMLGVTEPAGPALFEDPDFVEERDGTGEIYDERPPRRRGPIVLLVLLLLAGLGGLAYAGSLLLATKSFEVPDLAGTPEGVARNQIEGNDWTILIERERSDTFPDTDTVIRSEPGPGTELDEGESITLVLSDGFEFRTLPDVTGLSVDAARAQLESLLLAVNEAPEREFSEELADGAVTSWQVVGDSTLQAGAQVLPGETVSLTVSKGPEPRVIPDVSGLTLEEATAALSGLQLEIAVGDEVFSDDVEVGRVVTQSPAVGESIERGGVVTVQASKGPDLTAVPDLKGLAYADAQRVLTDAGFRIGTLLGTTEGSFVQLTVDGEQVAPGTEFRRGQVVDLVFL